MGARFSYLLLLYWMLTTVDANITWTEDCENQLIIADGVNLNKFCPETNQTQTIAAGWSWKISYSPRDGGTVVADQGSQLVTFVQMDSVKTSLMQHAVMDLSRHPLCFPSAYFDDIAIDWVTSIVYANSETCGEIRAFDLKRSLASTVYKDPYSHISSIAAYSQRGFLIWMQRSSIFRALMDGTDVRRLAVVLRNSGGDLAVDQKTSLVYWTNEETSEIFQCDLDGKNLLKLDLSVRNIVTGGFAILGSIIFWQEEESSGSAALYSADIRTSGERVVYRGERILDLEILPARATLDDSIENPCANSSCSHICVQSNSHMGHTCLCPDDYVLDRDGHNCTSVRRHLLVSTTMQGIWKIPTLDGTAKQIGLVLPEEEPNLPPPEPKLVVKNAPNATDVQCDPALRKILWAERGEKSTRILQVDMENPEKRPEIVFEHFATVRVSHEELEAFAVDWTTGNLYMAFHGESRILVCGRDNETVHYSKCAELFGNMLGPSIGGLVLDSTGGIMYWAHVGEDAAVIRGGMDGSWMEILAMRSQARSLTVGSHFHVYWVNQAQERIEFVDMFPSQRRYFDPLKHQNYTPQLIHIDGDMMYLVGQSKNDSSESIFRGTFGSSGEKRMWNTAEDQFVDKYVDGYFTNVTGLSICDLRRTRRTKNCGDQCDGICLRSGMGSFKCVCPIGFESHGTNGSSCKEIEEPPIIYSTGKSGNGTIRMKNGTSESLIHESLTSSMAFDPMRRELFWCLESDPEEDFAKKINPVFRLHLKENRSESTMAIPKPFYFQFEGPGKSTLTSITYQLEYDWIGENLYFVNRASGVGLCSASTGECTNVIQSNATIALDPPNGRMYWVLHSDTSMGIWKGAMDGSSGILILPNARAGFLTIDHTSKFLFWLTQDFSTGTTEVFYSDLDGKNVRSTIRLYGLGWRIRVTGIRLWMTFSSSRHGVGILSCDKETGDNLKTHELGQLEPVEEVVDFLVLSEPAQVQTHGDLCTGGGLCSHMCIPIPSGFMRCLCPTGYKIMSHGWTCDCADAKVCNMTIRNSNKPPYLLPSPISSSSRETKQVDCPGNEFACAFTCLPINKLCNGFPECPDFSDESKRCNEACNDAHGCSHTCSSSPTGPLCFCPPDQRLAADNMSCVLLPAGASVAQDGIRSTDPRNLEWTPWDMGSIFVAAVYWLRTQLTYYCDQMF